MSADAEPIAFFIRRLARYARRQSWTANIIIEFHPERY